MLVFEITAVGGLVVGLLNLCLIAGVHTKLQGVNNNVWQVWNVVSRRNRAVK